MDNRADPVFGRLAAIWIKLGLALAGLCLPLAIFVQPAGAPEAIFLKTQDIWVLAFGGVLLVAASRLRFPPSGLADKLADAPFWAVGLAALAVLVACRIGVSLVFEHFALSLDEFLADFSAEIFRRRLLMARLPDAWREYAEALQPIYVTVTAGNQYWASGYLPGNAYLRAAADVVNLKDWLNPVLAAVSILALYGVARQIWPQNRRRAVAAVALLATSSQFLIMAMSAYAMTPHLAFNLVWLWLFLRRKAASDIAAIALGFVACGMHQVIFHPLFVGPFILELWLTRAWRRAALFTLAYAAIGLFWISYTDLIYQWMGIASAAGPAAAGAAAGASPGWLATHVMPLIAKASPVNAVMMAEMLVRFMTWQNLLLTPLAIVGGLASWRAAGPMRPLALGFVVSLLVIGLLVPTQMHGWGYRYFHGLLGSGALLAVYGWARMTDGLQTLERRRAETGFLAACLISGLILVPARALQTRQFSHPHAAAYASILAQPSDIVLVDNGTVGFDMGSFVRNDPFLTNRPKVMLLSMLTPTQLTALCSGHSVSVWDARNPAAKGVPTFVSPVSARRSALLRAHLRAINCAA